MSKLRIPKEMRDIDRLLTTNGYEMSWNERGQSRGRGSHFVYVNRITHRHIVVNKKLNREVRQRIIKTINMGKEVV